MPTIRDRGGLIDVSVADCRPQVPTRKPCRALFAVDQKYGESLTSRPFELITQTSEILSATTRNTITPEEFAVLFSSSGWQLDRVVDLTG